MIAPTLLRVRKFAQCLDCDRFCISGHDRRCAMVHDCARKHALETGHRVSLTTTHFEEYCRDERTPCL